jgi:hypothetical protein
MTLAARVVTDLGTVYESATGMFVAPHDPAIERQSTRAGIY